MLIKSLSTLPNAILSKVINQIEVIFWQTASPQSFDDKEKQELFKYRYLVHYIENYPGHCYVILSQKDEVFGYLCGDGARSSYHQLKQLHAYYYLFEQYFSTYPAHFHINIAPNYQLKGLGAQLVAHYCEVLTLERCPGVHLITAQSARNVSFYQKLHFKSVQVKGYLNSNLLLLGKLLS